MAIIVVSVTSAISKPVSFGSTTTGFAGCLECAALGTYRTLRSRHTATEFARRLGCGTLGTFDKIQRCFFEQVVHDDELMGNVIALAEMHL